MSELKTILDQVLEVVDSRSKSALDELLHSLRPLVNCRKSKKQFPNDPVFEEILAWIPQFARANRDDSVRTRLSAKGLRSAAAPGVKLSPPAFKRLESLMQALQRDNDRRRKTPGDHSDAGFTDERIERALAREVIAKLPKMASKTARLDPPCINNSLISNEFERIYYEAHACYVYGFPVASAILCRALLEMALATAFDPNGDIERATPKGRSVFLARLEHAVKHRGLARKTADAAKSVKMAGDYAAHDLPRFQREFEPQLHESVEKTRNVLEEINFPDSPVGPAATAAPGARSSS